MVTEEFEEKNEPYYRYKVLSNMMKDDSNVIVKLGSLIRYKNVNKGNWRELTEINREIKKLITKRKIKKLSSNDRKKLRELRKEKLKLEKLKFNWNYEEFVDQIKENPILSRKQRYKLLKDLCLLYILNGGDMNFSNILINKETNQLYIIDFDDNLADSFDPNDQLYFNLNPFYFNNRNNNSRMFDFWVKDYKLKVFKYIIDNINIYDLNKIYISDKNDDDIFARRYNTCLRLLFYDDITREDKKFIPPEPISLATSHTVTYKGIKFSVLKSAL